MGRRYVALAAVAAILSFACAPQIVNPTVQAKMLTAQEKPKSTQSFTGTIVNSGEKYMLNTTTDKVTYELDNPQKASVFVGKKVKVIGTLDATKKLIHVEAIDEIT